MGTKSPSVSYYENKIKTTKRSVLLYEWSEAPITARDREFLVDIMEGLSLKELADKYYLTPSGITKYKRRLLTQLHRFDMRSHALTSLP